MKGFTPVLGNFPTLHYPPSRVAKLTGDDQSFFYAHWPHNCIRKAWAIAGSKGDSLEVRLRLKTVAAMELAHLREARGETLTESDVQNWTEKVRQLHELEICFGLFLPEEVEHLYQTGEAGPILRRHPEYKMQLEAGPVPLPIGMATLANLLKNYRAGANTDALIRETAAFTAKLARRDHCLDSLPQATKERFQEAMKSLRPRREAT